MKKADEWAVNNKNKVVLAIGIEHSKEQYLNKVKDYKNIWHYSDFKGGGESSLLNNFMIESTPTFFIIDEKKRIVNVLNTFPF